MSLALTPEHGDSCGWEFFSPQKIGLLNHLFLWCNLLPILSGWMSSGSLGMLSSSLSIMRCGNCGGKYILKKIWNLFKHFLCCCTSLNFLDPHVLYHVILFCSVQLASTLGESHHFRGVSARRDYRERCFSCVLEQMAAAMLPRRVPIGPVAWRICVRALTSDSTNHPTPNAPGADEIDSPKPHHHHHHHIHHKHLHKPHIVSKDIEVLLENNRSWVEHMKAEDPEYFIRLGRGQV
jgi:hypothetical protein